ncbi:C-type lectin mannose-binding isoform-like [Anolis sagrei]|uniref:C-type lectin mannose-binding isoform-like n=1 Tax=Anolis sagrei TaxID=38937 RepID=UPI00351FAA96
MSKKEMDKREWVQRKATKMAKGQETMNPSQEQLRELDRAIIALHLTVSLNPIIPIKIIDTITLRFQLSHNTSGANEVLAEVDHLDTVIKDLSPGEKEERLLPLQMRQVGTMGWTMTCGLFSRFYLCLLGLHTTSFLMHSVQAKTCPSGWLIFGNSCYGVFKTKLSWSQAEIACQSYHPKSHLVSILSEPEGRMLSRFLLDKNSRLGNMWIGLSDPNGVKKWVWSDMSPVNYLRWGSGQPKNNQRVGSCVYLAEDRYYEVWGSQPCNVPMNYICIL